jgi:hypothetical protein
VTVNFIVDTRTLGLSNDEKKTLDIEVELGILKLLRKFTAFFSFSYITFVIVFLPKFDEILFLWETFYAEFNYDVGKKPIC